VCVFSEQEVQVAARAEQHQAQQAQQSQQQHYRDQSSSSPSTSSLHHQPNGASSSSSSSATFNFAGNQAQRRPQLAQQGIAGMGGMGGSMRPPGKSGLTFDHILSRLQGELQKSRETGAELHTLTGAMNEIHDTLGGNLVCAKQ
jgi:type II secretory pathway pseudopilin PulG